MEAVERRRSGQHPWQGIPELPTWTAADDADAMELFMNLPSNLCVSHATQQQKRLKSRIRLTNLCFFIFNAVPLISAISVQARSTKRPPLQLSLKKQLRHSQPQRPPRVARRSPRNSSWARGGSILLPPARAELAQTSAASAPVLRHP